MVQYVTVCLFKLNHCFHLKEKANRWMGWYMAGFLGSVETHRTSIALSKMFSQGTMTPMSTTFQVMVEESKLSWIPWTSARFALLSPKLKDNSNLSKDNSYFWTLEVAGLVVVASQHNTHNVLANIVHITLHCGLTNDFSPDSHWKSV